MSHNRRSLNHNETAKNHHRIPIYASLTTLVLLHLNKKEKCMQYIYIKYNFSASVLKYLSCYMCLIMSKDHLFLPLNFLPQDRHARDPKHHQTNGICSRVDKPKQSCNHSSDKGGCLKAISIIRERKILVRMQ